MINKRILYPRLLAPYPLLKGWRSGWPLALSLGGRCAASPPVVVSQHWPPPSGPAPSDAGRDASCCPWGQHPPLARSTSTPVLRSSTCFQLHPCMHSGERERGQKMEAANEKFQLNSNLSITTRCVKEHALNTKPRLQLLMNINQAMAVLLCSPAMYSY